jgi:hypothetical protein
MCSVQIMGSGPAVVRIEWRVGDKNYILELEWDPAFEFPHGLGGMPKSGASCLTDISRYRFFQPYSTTTYLHIVLTRLLFIYFVV